MLYPISLNLESRMAQLSNSEKIEILIDQIGRMTESITELRMTVESGFTELKAASERQERNIDRLVGIVETLIQERRSS
ncbi:hypothetical protein H6F89_19150 [Cyanobacteria bacterium FACHB-63]|nr:hypothetical protein [Cyanobacteria bacterium FACHB-63]